MVKYVILAASVALLAGCKYGTTGRTTHCEAKIGRTFEHQCTPILRKGDHDRYQRAKEIERQQRGF